MGIFNKLLTRSSKDDMVQQVVDAKIRSIEELIPSVSGSMTITDNQEISNKESLGGELTLSTVFAAVDMISSSLSVLPVTVQVYESEDKEDKTWLEDVFKNGLLNTNRLIKQMVTDMLLFGNGYAYINRDKRGKATSLEYLFAKDVQSEWKKETRTLSYRCYYINEGKPILPKDIIHFVKNSRNGYQGISVLSLAHNAVNVSNKTEKAVSDYYNSGLNISGLLHAKQPMTKQQASQALKSVEGTVDTGKGKFVKFIPFDLEFQRLTESATDAALLETRKYNLSEIARFFSISPALLQDLSNSKYSSIEAANLLFLTLTLLPYIVLIEEELNKKLVPKKSKLIIDLDERLFLRTDAKSTASYYSTLVNGGLITINEARVALGYKPKDGADDLIIPYTDINLNSIGKEDVEETEETVSELENNEDK